MIKKRKKRKHYLIRDSGLTNHEIISEKGLGRAMNKAASEQGTTAKFSGHLCECHAEQAVRVIPFPYHLQAQAQTQQRHVGSEFTKYLFWFRNGIGSPCFHWKHDFISVSRHILLMKSLSFLRVLGHSWDLIQA